MTTNEQKLSAQLHSLCGVVRSEDIGNGIVATLRDNTITLTVARDQFGPFQVITLSDDNLKGLEQFLVNVGWRCD